MGIRLVDKQIEIELQAHNEGKVTFEDLGANEPSFHAEGGNLRMKVVIGAVDFDEFYRMPMLEFKYSENIHESEWVVEFNGENILERSDHSGHSTMLLFSRNRLKDLIQRHENNLLIHGDFSEEVDIDLVQSHFHLFGK